MKKIFYFWTVLLLVVTISCNNDDNELVVKTTITTELEVTIVTGEDYFYDLGSFGDEEGAGITTAASHAEISELFYELDPNRYVYKYRPETGFIGTDFVVLTTAKGSNGGSPNPNIEVIEISISVIAQ